MKISIEGSIKNVKQFLYVIVFVFTFVFLSYTQAQTLSAGIGGFSVVPVFPENQNPDSARFFDLAVYPGQRQEIYIEIKNDRDEYITVEINIFTVGTNINGIIDYAAPGNMDDSLQFDFGTMASLPEGNYEVTIPSRETILVPVLLEIPDDGFSGFALGSIHVLLGITEAEILMADTFVNRFASIVAVMLHDITGGISYDYEYYNESYEDGTEAYVLYEPLTIDPDFLLGNIIVDTDYYNIAIIAPVHNIVPIMVMDVIAGAQLFPLGSAEAVITIYDFTVDFAPNAIFGFSLLSGINYYLYAGMYLVKIVLENQGQSWVFEQHFELFENEANIINTMAETIQQMPVFTDPGDTNRGFEGFILLASVAVGVALSVAFIIRTINIHKNTEMLLKARREHKRKKEMEENLRGVKF